MKLLIYGLNYSPELTGSGKYTGEMAEWFSQQNAGVRVVTAPPYYPEWKIAPGYSGWRYRKQAINGVDIIRCPLYVPAQPSTITRLLHLASFAFSSFWALFFCLKWRPDVIITIAPTVFVAPTALLFGVVTRAKTLIHIQDYEVGAMFGLGMMNQGIVGKLALKVESWIFRHFDRVSTISSKMIQLAENKGVNPDRILYLPNWVDTSFVTPQSDGNGYRSKWGFTASHHVLMYSGNIGRKQGLEIIVEAASAFKDNDHVQFVIIGQGAYRTELECLARNSGLTNIHFKDLVPYEDLPQLLAAADIHLVVQKKGAADVVLPSKLTSILSAGGNALITAEKDTELGLLVEKHPGIAELVEPENLNAFLAGINRLLKKDTKKTNKVARAYAVNYLAKDAILFRFYDELRELCGLMKRAK